ncbi:hypothetical protein HY989_00965 [Candidatus Micrarchaeota archaeon]|nr:hypothetical protein [Candidatus Micrarchaeota archaeon]
MGIALEFALFGLVFTLANTIVYAIWSSFAMFVYYLFKAGSIAPIGSNLKNIFKASAICAIMNTIAICFFAIITAYLMISMGDVAATSGIAINQVAALGVVATKAAGRIIVFFALSFSFFGLVNLLLLSHYIRKSKPNGNFGANLKTNSKKIRENKSQL